MFQIPRVHLGVNVLVAGEKTCFEIARVVGIELASPWLGRVVVVMNIRVMQKEEERAVDRCRLLADEYVATGQSIPAADQHVLDAILDRQGQPPTLDDGLGLFDPAERTPLLSPKVKNESLSEQKSWVTPAAVKCLHSLDELVHQHRETPVTIQFGREQREELLANANSGLFSIFLSGTSWKAPQTIQLKEIWQNWQDKRPAELRDEDGLELLRALTRLTAGQYERTLPLLNGPLHGEPGCNRTDPAMCGVLVQVSLTGSNIKKR